MVSNKSLPAGRKRSLLHGFPLQQRLPLLICGFLICIVIAFSATAYFMVRKVSLQAGRERLNGLTTQLSTMFSQSAQGILAADRTIANNEAIRQCLHSGGAEANTEALAAIQKVRTDTTSVLVELLDAEYKPILRSFKHGSVGRLSVDRSYWPSTRPDSGHVGKIFRDKDSMYYPIVTTINENKQPLGYLVRWRQMTATPKALQQLSGLLGTGAALYLANADGSLWTDMIKPVPSPLPKDFKPGSNINIPAAGGKDAAIASLKPIGNTPWMLLVEFPTSVVLSNANEFLRWLLIIGVILIAAGSFIAWIMSRNMTRPLKQLTAAASALASGDYSTAVAVDRRDEIGKLARAFNAMAEQVHHAHADLETKVSEARLLGEELRTLSAHLQNIREQERIHIAREMHDELGQLLTGFKMDVVILKRKLVGFEQNGVPDKLAAMEKIVDSAVNFVRKLSAELRPSLLDEVGLVPALEWHSQEFEKRYNIKVRFQSSTETVQTSSVIATGLFRMFQESLTNVARHSGAKAVEAVLQATDDQLDLSICDDGKGFNSEEPGERKTLGLLGMRERAIMIGGKLNITSEPGKGTTVNIVVPLN
jgi:signal transduction histidine kinase